MPNKKNKIDKDTLIKIVEEIIIKEGVENLSIRKIADRADVSIGGVQYVFGNKEGILKAVVDKFDKQYNDVIDVLMKDDKSSESRAKAHIKFIFEYTDLDSCMAITSLFKNTAKEEEFQEWYRFAINSIDDSTFEGRKLRLALLLTEGFFTLIGFRYLKVSREEIDKIYSDIKKLLL
ncbi:MAG: TetR/AcrR family transcriptional regulator [Campylobacteraceae bacterium]